ncbi:hypothetical protein GQ42DRAFT_162241 [Ramicandelaber brevisporus]|nr:hypothetical protein GQ42DRAFT_162241 [Ramicandelaber brevisporus]
MYPFFRIGLTRDGRGRGRPATARPATARPGYYHSTDSYHSNYGSSTRGQRLANSTSRYLKQYPHDGVLSGSIPLRLKSTSPPSRVMTHRLSYSTVDNAYYENGTPIKMAQYEPVTTTTTTTTTTSQTTASTNDGWVRKNASSFTYEDATWVTQNMNHEVEYDHQMAYLSRLSGDKIGVIGWRVHFINADRVIETASMLLNSAVHDEVSSVTWLIRPLSKAVVIPDQTDVNNEQQQQTPTATTPDGGKEDGAALAAQYGITAPPGVTVQQVREFRDFSGPAPSTEQKDRLVDVMVTRGGFTRLDQLSPSFDSVNAHDSGPPSGPFNATSLLQGEYGFELFAVLAGDDQDWPRIKAQLFRVPLSFKIAQNNTTESPASELEVPDCPFDIRTTWVPVISITELKLAEGDKQPVFDDAETSDFVLTLEGDPNRPIHLHSKVVGPNCVYFGDMLSSSMVEAQQRKTEIAAEENETDSDLVMLRKCLEFTYTGRILTSSEDSGNNSNDDDQEAGVSKDGKFVIVRSEPQLYAKLTIDEWMQALHYSARFGITSLLNMCEQALSYLTPSNAESDSAPDTQYGLSRDELLDIGTTYGALQLISHIKRTKLLQSYLNDEPYVCPRHSQGPRYHFDESVTRVWWEKYTTSLPSDTHSPPQPPQPPQSEQDDETAEQEQPDEQPFVYVPNADGTGREVDADFEAQMQELLRQARLNPRHYHMPVMPGPIIAWPDGTQPAAPPQSQPGDRPSLNVARQTGGPRSSNSGGNHQPPPTSSS